MRTIEEIKAAAAELSPDEQVELFRWWIESDTFKQQQLAALKRDLAAGAHAATRRTAWRPRTKLE
jgi:hypothetical protein